MSRRRAWAVLWRSSLECIRSLQQLGFGWPKLEVTHFKVLKMFRFRKVLEEIKPTPSLGPCFLTPNFLAGSGSGILGFWDEKDCHNAIYGAKLDQKNADQSVLRPHWTPKVNSLVFFVKKLAASGDITFKFP